ncbi:MAG: hypothetical protein LH614_19045 [Pyrinomonadaceae bacterium]|nr:hypothetical protein [Pyrinomonadaceae bacterium]
MSGCGFVVLLGVFERFSGRNILLEVYIGVLASLICVSFYLAWQDERNSKNVANQALDDKEKIVANKENDLFDSKQVISGLRQQILEEKEKKTPKLDGFIEELYCAEVMEGKIKKTAVTLKLTIRNLGGMPSVATNLMPLISVVGKNPRQCHLVHFANELRLGYGEKNEAIVIKAKDMIYEKTIESIQPGSMVFGYVHFRTTLQIDEIRANDTFIKVLFSDVTGKICEANYVGALTKNLPAPKYTPSLGTKTTTMGKSRKTSQKRQAKGDKNGDDVVKGVRHTNSND